MGGLINVALASVVFALPCEYHIDCNGWDGKAMTEYKFRITAWDGSTYQSAVQLFPGSDPEVARDLIWNGLKANKWRGRFVGDGILVLEGSKKAGVRSVEFTSDGWKPVVHRVLLLPNKK